MQPIVPTFYDFVRTAIFHQNVALQMLTANPNRINARSSSGETALHYVVIENYLEAARFLIDRGADVNTTSGDETPLIHATVLGYHEMVVLLIAHGANIEARDLCESTPFLLAAAHGYTDICDTLLHASADAHVRDCFHHSVWDVALTRKRQQIVDVLAKHGHFETDEV